VIAFYDPHFSENPICSLCNYQTYVLYNLRNITRLDTVFIEPKVKDLTENTFLRKTMFYNMKIKTIKRSFSSLVRLAKKAFTIKSDSINDDLAAIRVRVEEHPADAGATAALAKKLSEFAHLKKLKKAFKQILYSI
jgi:hypothetical protein